MCILRQLRIVFLLTPKMSSWIPVLAVETPNFQRNLLKLQTSSKLVGHLSFEENGFETPTFKSKS